MNSTERTGSNMFYIGLIGFVVVVVLNLFAILVNGYSKAGFFGTLWWEQWFSIYAVMASVLIIGTVFRLISRSKRNNP